MADMTLAIMDAMAEKIEALTTRIETLEKALQETCSCRAWVERLRPDAGDDGPFLTPDEVHTLVWGSAGAQCPELIF